MFSFSTKPTISSISRSTAELARTGVLQILQDKIYVDEEDKAIQSASSSLRDAVYRGVNQAVNQYFTGSTPSETPVKIDPEVVQAAVANVLAGNVEGISPNFRKSRGTRGTKYDAGTHASTSTYGGRKNLEDALRKEIAKALDDPGTYPKYETISPREHASAVHKSVADLEERIHKQEALLNPRSGNKPTLEKREQISKGIEKLQKQLLGNKKLTVKRREALTKATALSEKRTKEMKVSKEFTKATPELVKKILTFRVVNEAGRGGIVTSVSASLTNTVQGAVKEALEAHGAEFSRDHQMAAEAALNKVLTQGGSGSKPNFKESKGRFGGKDKSGTRASTSTYGGAATLAADLKKEIAEALANPSEYLARSEVREVLTKPTVSKDLPLNATDKQLIKIRQDIEAKDEEIKESKSLKEKLKLLQEKAKLIDKINGVSRSYANYFSQRDSNKAASLNALREHKSRKVSCAKDIGQVLSVQKFALDTPSMVSRILKDKIRNEAGKTGVVTSASRSLQSTVTKSMQEALDRFQGELNEDRKKAVEAAVSKVLAKGGSDSASKPNFANSKGWFGRGNSSGFRASTSTYGGEETLSSALREELAKALATETPLEYSEKVEAEVAATKNQTAYLSRKDRKELSSKVYTSASSADPEYRAIAEAVADVPTATVAVPAPSRTTQAAAEPERPVTPTIEPIQAPALPKAPQRPEESAAAIPTTAATQPVARPDAVARSEVVASREAPVASPRVATEPAPPEAPERPVTAPAVTSPKPLGKDIKESIDKFEQKLAERLARSATIGGSSATAPSTPKTPGTREKKDQKSL